MSEKENSQESSDDFDESALSALASPSMPPPASDTESADDDDDDSVLDLRALAASMAPPAPESATEPVTVSSEAPVPAAAKPAEPAPSVAEAAAVAAPVLVTQPEQGSSSGMWVGLLVAAGVAAAAAFYFIGGSADAEDPVASAAPSAVAPSSAAPGDPVPIPNSAAGEPSEGETGAEVTVAEQEGLQNTTAVIAAPIRPGTERGRPTPEAAMAAPAAETEMAAPTAPTMEDAPTATEEPAAPTMTGLDSLLDNALGGRPTAGGTMTEPTMAEAPTMAPAPSGDLPNTPSRANVSRTLGRLLPAIRQCAAEQVGMANAAIIVNSNGSVGSVNISGSPFGGTPQGACMEGVIRRARFEAFSQSTFRLTYPFAIRARVQ